MTDLKETVKNAILHGLEKGECDGKQLQTYVFSVIKPKKSQIDTKQKIAFISGYKELEAENKIAIKRPYDVPFPMTDDTTRFELKK